MSIKVRADLLAVAQRVHDGFGGEGGVIGREQIERAIEAHAQQKIFTPDEHTCLLRLRSQAFKSPDKKLRLG